MMQKVSHGKLFTSRARSAAPLEQQSAVRTQNSSCWPTSTKVSHGKLLRQEQLPASDADGAPLAKPKSFPWETLDAKLDNGTKKHLPWSQKVSHGKLLTNHSLAPRTKLRRDSRLMNLQQTPACPGFRTSGALKMWRTL